jgi:hypothetical protein
MRGGFGSVLRLIDATSNAGAEAGLLRHARARQREENGDAQHHSTHLAWLLSACRFQLVPVVVAAAARLGLPSTNQPAHARNAWSL